MARQLKRWESPRREGRNDKGRGGSARQRQRRKQFQALRQKLKEQPGTSDDRHSTTKQNQQKREAKMPPFLFATMPGYADAGCDAAQDFTMAASRF